MYSSLVFSVDSRSVQPSPQSISEHFHTSKRHAVPLGHHLPVLTTAGPPSATLRDENHTTCGVSVTGFFFFVSSMSIHVAASIPFLVVAE